MASFPHDKHAGSPAGGVVARNYSGVWILVATILGSSMGFIDATAVNVILPVMQEDLGATLTELQWFIEAYALFLAALLLVGGAFGDRLGRKRVFMWGIAIFAGASIWAGLAPNAEQLIAARAVQGIGPGVGGAHQRAAGRRLQAALLHRQRARVRRRYVVLGQRPDHGSWTATGRVACD